MTSLRFHWTSPGMVSERRLYYPPEEGDRTRAFSGTVWSEVETVSSARLREIQVEKLQRVIAFAWERSAFYRELWKLHGVTPKDVRDLADLRKLPIVRKEDFEQSQRAKPLFGTVPTFPADSPEYMKFWATSGSTGAPRLWLATKEDHESDQYLFIRAFYAYGIRPGWRGYLAFAYPPMEAFWKAHYAAEAMGCAVIPKGPLPTAVMLKNLMTWKADFMCCTPTYALRQIEVAEQEGIRLPDIGVKVIVLAGEPGASVPATKRLIEQHWGARVNDAMGMTETSGPILFTCDQQAASAQPLAHMTSDYCILECLHPGTLEPVPSDQEGVLVVTSLFRLGMPVIRLWTNDIIMPTDQHACGCGRTLPLVKGGILGRLDDVVFVKGVKLYPAMVESAVRSIPGLGYEYLLNCHDGTVEIVVEAGNGLHQNEYAPLAERLRDEIKRFTTLTLPVQIVGPHTLTRSENKSRRLQSRRGI